jgi:small subunit ribosomal protein S8
MSIVDPLSDLLTRVRNGHSAGKKTVLSPYSKERSEVLRVLQDEGYIRHFSVQTGKNGHQELSIELKYVDNIPVIVEINRVSKPGRRVYSGIDKLPLVANGLGISILSTNKGIMSDTNARKVGVGGEVICTVY